MSEKVKEILVKTKELLMKNGWTQGVFHDSDGCRCLVGALNDAAPIVTSYRSGHSDLYDEAYTHLKMTIDPSIPALSYWNDVEYRTFDEVIEALDKAISTVPSQVLA